MNSETVQLVQDAPDTPAIPHMDGGSPMQAVSLADTAAIMLTETVTRSKLSPMLAGLAEVISIDAALTLCEAFGGGRLYIAEKPTRRGAIARAIGFEAARKLSKTYGREELNIPRAAAVHRAIRNHKIKRERKNKTVSELAREFNLSPRQVWTILAGGRDAIDQKGRA